MKAHVIVMRLNEVKADIFAQPVDVNYLIRINDNALKPA